MTDEDIAQQKQALRMRMKALRAAHVPSVEAHASIVAHLERLLTRLGHGAVGGVLPLSGEIDLSGLLKKLRAGQREICLPETPPIGSPLTFRRWGVHDMLRKGRFGTTTPTGPIISPQIVLVPLLAYDRACFRLGYGGGYYDRTLVHTDLVAIGFAWSWQEVDHVPTDGHDVALHHIVTERETITR